MPTASLMLLILVYLLTHVTEMRRDKQGIAIRKESAQLFDKQGDRWRELLFVAPPPTPTSPPSKTRRTPICSAPTLPQLGNVDTVDDEDDIRCSASSPLGSAPSLPIARRESPAPAALPMGRCTSAPASRIFPHRQATTATDKEFGRGEAGDADEKVPDVSADSMPAPGEQLQEIIAVGESNVEMDDIGQGSDVEVLSPRPWSIFMVNDEDELGKLPKVKDMGELSFSRHRRNAIHQRILDMQEASPVIVPDSSALASSAPVAAAPAAANANSTQSAFFFSDEGDDQLGKLPEMLDMQKRPSHSQPCRKAVQQQSSFLQETQVERPRPGVSAVHDAHTVENLLHALKEDKIQFSEIERTVEKLKTRERQNAGEIKKWQMIAESANRAMETMEKELVTLKQELAVAMHRAAQAEDRKEEERATLKEELAIVMRRLAQADDQKDESLLDQALLDQRQVRAEQLQRLRQLLVAKTKQVETARSLKPFAKLDREESNCDGIGSKEQKQLCFYSAPIPLERQPNCAGICSKEDKQFQEESSFAGIESKEHKQFNFYCAPISLEESDCAGISSKEDKQLQEESIQMKLKIHGVDYDQLVSDVALTRSVKTEIKRAVVEEAGNQIKESSVRVDLTKGSVVATIKIFERTPDWLKSSSTLTNSVATKVSKVPGINAVTNGSIVVSKADSEESKCAGIGSKEHKQLCFYSAPIHSEESDCAVIGGKEVKQFQKESNCAGIGSKEDKELRKEAAITEEAWHGCGMRDGIDIWRIENFKVKHWPKEMYGSFYEGDSYIILKTTKDPESEKLNRDIYFWLGSKTSIDEQGTAAYKTVELDEYFDGEPVQHREVHGYESDHFLALFPQIHYMQGGIESGFRHVGPEHHKSKLFQVRKVGTATKIVEVPVSKGSMNTGDCFILDCGDKIFKYFGPESSPFEKARCGTAAENIECQRHGKATVMQHTDDANTFWHVLGGEGPIKPASEASDDKMHMETSILGGTRDELGEGVLFKFSDDSGKLRLIEKKRGDISISDLDSQDVYILDTIRDVFIWIGKEASKHEKQEAMNVAIHHLEDTGRPRWTPIAMFKEGQDIQNKIWLEVMHN